VETAWKWPTAEQWKSADLLVLYYRNHDWSPEQLKQLDDYLARGGGLVPLHSAVIHDKDPEDLAKRIGIAFQPGKSKYRHGPIDLKIARDTPLTRGLKTIHFVDETYWPLFGDVSKIRVLATADEEGKSWPMLWTYRPGKGRVFASVLGHYSWTFDDPLFRILILRGLAWAAGEPVERFRDLVTEGASID
jgi:type 1 glutamine amidotransferase